MMNTLLAQQPSQTGPHARDGQVHKNSTQMSGYYRVVGGYESVPKHLPLRQLSAHRFREGDVQETCRL